MTLPAGIVSISMIPMIKNESTASQHRILLTKRDVMLSTEHDVMMMTKRDDEFVPDIEKRQTVEACGAQLTSLKPGDSGMILSPNYPDLYPPSAKCAWWLQVIDPQLAIHTRRHTNVTIYSHSQLIFYTQEYIDRVPYFH